MSGVMCDRSYYYQHSMVKFFYFFPHIPKRYLQREINKMFNFQGLSEATSIPSLLHPGRWSILTLLTWDHQSKVQNTVELFYFDTDVRILNYVFCAHPTCAWYNLTYLRWETYFPIFLPSRDGAGNDWEAEWRLDTASLSNELHSR